MATKTKNNPEAFSSENSFNITLPPSWADLDDSQLLCFFTLMSHDLQIEEVLTVCLFKWADLRLLCRTANGSYLVKQRHRPKLEATLTIQQIQSATAALDYLRSFPSFPTCITKIGKARPLEADFQGVPFTSFISHRQHPLRMGFPRQLRPLPSPLPTHLRHRVLHPPHR